MTGPDLGRDLEAIGRRLSPRLGQPYDAVVGRATASVGGGARWPRPGRLGGAVGTLAVAAAFGTLLAVGVATRPGPDAPVDRGPSVAMATTTPGVPASTDPPGAGEATPVPGGGRVATAPAATTVAPTRPGPPPSEGPVLTLPAPPGQGPQPTAAPPAAATPGGTPMPAQTPPPSQAASTMPPRFAASATAPARARVVLSEKDSGRTVTVHPGDVVEVDLSSPRDTSHWTVPSSTDETVVSPGSGNTRSDGSARAVFTTPGRTGSADLQASRLPACASATPRCLPPQRVDFRVTIVVA
ncbi:MAG: hypothetical protein JWM18_1433 [Chloroflexi bacterium]|nr:hypothetical protein [Chloroflexota bacterium]